MGQRFVACDREQSFLLPPDVREWLPSGHLAWFVIDAVAEMNLEGFYAAYRVDGRSRPPYDPAMMVAVLLYAYARGIRSSRVIERACEEDVAFRVLAAQERPDHATLARFVERHQEAIAGLFGEVLTLCARSGLVKVGVIAVDGTKVHANASRDENVDYEQLAREIVEEAKAVDAAEDELYGESSAARLPRQPRLVAVVSAGAHWTPARDEPPSQSTDDRLTLVSGSACERADVVAVTTAGRPGQASQGEKRRRSLVARARRIRCSASWSVTSRKMASQVWLSTPQSLPARTMTASASGAT
jgi:transposase